MMELLKNKTMTFYIGLVGALIAMITDVVFVIGDHADRTFSVLAFILMLLGALVYAVWLVKDFKFIPLVSGGLFVGGFAVELYTVLPSLSDVWNGVNFIGGNAVFGSIVMGLFLVSTICMIIACFGDRERKF